MGTYYQLSVRKVTNVSFLASKVGFRQMKLLITPLIEDGSIDVRYVTWRQYKMVQSVVRSSLEQGILKHISGLTLVPPIDRYRS